MSLNPTLSNRTNHIVDSKADGPIKIVFRYTFRGFVGGGEEN
jgi:hypothetical protein